MIQILKQQLFFLLLLFLTLFSCCGVDNGPEANKYKAIQEKIGVGNHFPEFSLVDSKGEIQSEEDFSNQYVFYMFWATWCASCVDNIIAIRDFHKQGLLEDVKFVGLSVDEDSLRWQKFIYQYDMDDYMTNFLIGKDRENPLSDFIYTQLYNLQKPTFGKPLTTYAYITPRYCLVKNGLIEDRKPILPKDKELFIAQFK